MLGYTIDEINKLSLEDYYASWIYSWFKFKTQYRMRKKNDPTISINKKGVGKLKIEHPEIEKYEENLTYEMIKRKTITPLKKDIDPNTIYPVNEVNKK